MAFFEGIKMTGGYGNGPDIISSCSVNVNKGEIVSILGPNGAGKSSFLNIISGDLDFYNGDVFYNQRNLAEINIQEKAFLRSVMLSLIHI